MKANKLFLLASLLLSGSMIPITAQNKKEKKQQREQDSNARLLYAKAYKNQCGPGNAYERRQQTPDFRLFFRNKKRFGIFLSALFRSGV